MCVNIFNSINFLITINSLTWTSLHVTFIFSRIFQKYLAVESSDDNEVMLKQ